MQGHAPGRAGASYDVIIIGAGGAGLFCAIEAGKRGRRVLVIDHAKKPGEKIRISGGGRCNFTNLHATPANYLSENPRFCISALKGYTQRDFIRLVEKHRIAWHEKTLGQLFCDGSSQQIIDMLLAEIRTAGAELLVDTKIADVTKEETGFRVGTNKGTFTCASLVIASGGKSIPKMGATGFGYDIAKRFGLKIIAPRPALVPLTFPPALMKQMEGLSGISADATVSCGGARFAEALLFTHKGLSGPSILQISSYWKEGEEIEVNLVPATDIFEFLKQAKAEQPRQEPATALARLLPKRLADRLAENAGMAGRLADMPDKQLKTLAAAVNAWRVLPNGTEGFRIAEVTAGGVDTAELSSKTMEARKVPGLYFIGEVVDVTGHLGGFNFQWAWSSAFAAGRYV